MKKMKPSPKKFKISKSFLIFASLATFMGLAVYLTQENNNSNFLKASLLGTPSSTATIETDLGDIKIGLFSSEAPKAVKNFIGLAKEKKYDDTIIHEINPEMYAQMGDYEYGDGRGGKSFWNNTFADEISWQIKPLKGTIGMANMGPDTNASQFFILLEDAPHLSGRHTFFARVLEDSDSVLEALSETSVNYQGVPKEPIKIKSITVN